MPWVDRQTRAAASPPDSNRHPNAISRQFPAWTRAEPIRSSKPALPSGKASRPVAYGRNSRMVFSTSVPSLGQINRGSATGTIAAPNGVSSGQRTLPGSRFARASYAPGRRPAGAACRCPGGGGRDRLIPACTGDTPWRRRPARQHRSARQRRPRHRDRRRRGGAHRRPAPS